MHHLIRMAVFGLACFWVLHVRFHDDGSFVKVLSTASWGVFAEWPAAWASVVMLLLAGCVFFLVLALDELLPLLNRECFSVGVYCGLMLVPMAIFGAGSFSLVRALL